MKRPAVFVAAWLLCGWSATSSAQGVQTGTIRGTVKDEQGLPLHGVFVTGTSPALQSSRSSVTDTEGGYVFRRLPPGDYNMFFELSGFAPIKGTSTVPLGLTVEQNVTLKVAGVTQAVQVVARARAPIATPIVGANFKHDEIELLANPRTLAGIAQLSPGLTENSPNAGQVVINGAFAFDNVFMLNGVDVNDNLFGSPQNLFIEDAIQETQVLTSGITAEYGRFTGGVVNAVTKSGGDTFAGSFRTNFSNPAWTDETPFETSAKFERPNDLQESYEATLGGAVVKERLWFFTAGRYSRLSAASTLPQTNIPYTQTDTNKRGEFKLTGTAAQDHTLQGGYLNNATAQASRPDFSFTIDKFGIGDRTLPNWYGFVNYQGVLSNNLIAEAQYSQRKFGFENSGPIATAIVDSPIITLNQAIGHFNALYLDASDPEQRNNRQLTGNVTYFLSKAGRHELKGGYEFFRSQRTGGNSQSSTNYVFDADYATDRAGNALLDSQGHLIPVFTPYETQIEHWLPVRGAVLNVDNNSAFAQDHWVINKNLSADLGVRYERVRSEATGGLIGVDTDTIVPRLAVAYDVQGNGKHLVHATYGWYSGRYNEAQIGGNNKVGNPDATFGVYTGPAGQGRNFAPGFNPANYQIVSGTFPTANIFLAPGLNSPVVRELTTSYGAELGGGKGFAEATYIYRKTTDIIEDFSTLSNGVTRVVKSGTDFGTFTNVVYRNTDLARREYQGLLFQVRYSPTNRWSVNGHYTVQLKNEGNYEGEATNQPGLTGRIGDYPEAFDAARSYPDGRLQDFQRHKLRIWSIYTLGLGRAGDLSVSGLWRVDSGLVYSLRATGQRLTATQLANIAAYPDAPSSQTVFFGERGAQDFKGYGLFDTSINYNIPMQRALRPWVKFDVYNLFNNQKLIRWNTTVRQDASSRKDSLGLATGYTKGPTFGQAQNNSNFPIPFTGLTGGRTFRVAVGLRF